MDHAVVGEHLRIYRREVRQRFGEATPDEQEAMTEGSELPSGFPFWEPIQPLAQAVVGDLLGDRDQHQQCL